MEQLKEAILREAVVLNEQVLKLDAILNHQVDPELMMACGKLFADMYREEGITKVMTVESSGISVAFAAALELKVPLLFARRKKTVAGDQDFWCERVPSFTKGRVTDLLVAKAFLQEKDTVLFIDDIIANGDAAKGLIRIIRRSGAKLAGVGIVVEKSFQSGGDSIREQGIRVDSLVRISSMKNGQIEFKD